MLFKFVLEILGFIFLFWLFRLAVVKTFPVHKLHMELSYDSKKALKRFRNRYWVLLLIFSVLLTFAFYHALSFGLSAWHSRFGASALMVETPARLVPAALMGIILGSLSARGVNHLLQRDGLSFFLEGQSDEFEGFDRLKIRGIQLVLSMIVALLLVFAQFNYYIRVYDDAIVYRQAIFEDPIRVPLQEVVVEVDSTAYTEFVLYAGSDTLWTRNFAGQKRAFVAKIDPEI